MKPWRGLHGFTLPVSRLMNPPPILPMKNICLHHQILFRVKTTHDLAKAQTSMYVKYSQRWYNHNTCFEEHILEQEPGLMRHALWRRCMINIVGEKWRLFCNKGGEVAPCTFSTENGVKGISSGSIVLGDSGEKLCLPDTHLFGGPWFLVNFISHPLFCPPSIHKQPNRMAGI